MPLGSTIDQLSDQLYAAKDRAKRAEMQRDELLQMLKGIQRDWGCSIVMGAK